MSTLGIGLLGKLTVRRGAQPLDGFSAAKVQELLGYLLMHRDRPHPRESLATVIWGDCPSGQAKKQLRQVLWQLQGALDQHAEPTDSALLVVRPEWISLNAATSFWLDVAALEEASALAAGIAGSDLDEGMAHLLESAARLGEGDLLEGLYADWCLVERERLRNMYLAIREKLMAYCEAHGLYEQGLAHGEAILRHDQARERTHQRLMRLHARAGDRVAALRQYERCVAVLDEELGVGPSRRTVALHEQIRTEQFPAANASESLWLEATLFLPLARPLADTLAQLKRLRTSIQVLDSQLQQGIEAVEGALRQRGRSDPPGAVPPRDGPLTR
jgi:DNA-binding SARP family transcriptional activator